jgi:hypothetical protein
MLLLLLLLLLLLMMMMIGRYQKRIEIHSRCIACCCNRTI